jgi:alanine racemase
MQLTWIEISRQAFDHNINFYKQVIGPDAALALVIKSNAYGHGIREVATIAQAHPHVDWFCTTSLSEAVFLREMAVTKPILVMTFIDDDPEKIFTHDIAVIGHDIETITMLNTLGKTLGKQAKIHIKIDTGLSRLGFYPDEALAVIQHIKESLPYITIQGLYTHFADSGGLDHDFNDHQLQQFNTVLSALQKQQIDIPYKHTCKTSAITTVKDSHFNLIRLGAGAYGLKPPQTVSDITKVLYPDFEPQQIMTWKTRIMHIRHIPADTYIGYDKTFKTTRPTRIAILPIGYFEGYDRRLTNKGVVKIQTNSSDTSHEYAPVIGRICMSVTMIDITDVEQAKIGDEVIVLGNAPGITAYDLAQTIESFNPREITARINPVIPRIITR